jgi:glutathione S-transferase
MYTLFYKPGACSMAVHVLLNELGQSFKLEHFQTKDGKTNPELAKLNPREQVPVLVKGDFALREGGAILNWLCDEHESALLPRQGEARARALQWLMFANATLHPAYGRVFFLKRAASEAAQKELMEPTAKHIQSLWNDIEAQLEKTKFLAGDELSVADILVTVIAIWTPNVPQTITFGPKTKTLLNSVISRPSYQKALEAEGITYKVAA